MQHSRINRRHVAAVATGVVGALAFGASPALAHNFRAYVVSQEGIVRGYAEVYQNHTAFRVCDSRADNIGVYGRMQLQNGTIVDVVDPDGSGSACGTASTNSGNPVTSIEAVWRGGATSGWRAA
jgi:hypothetical protein